MTSIVRDIKTLIMEWMVARKERLAAGVYARNPKKKLTTV